nr:RDD family protein [Psychromicrobium silvestre]
MSKYPGERLGLPQSGPTSIARAGRRILALLIDWGLCSLISYFLFQGAALATLGIFLIEQVVLVGTLGYSIGHRVAGIQVVRQTQPGRPVFQPAGLLAGVVRGLLLCLLIPAVITDPDHRGLHDRAMNTVLVRR